MPDDTSRRAVTEEPSTQEEGAKALDHDFEPWLGLDRLPLCVAYVAADGTYRYASPVYAEWVGRERDDIVGRSVVEVLGHGMYDKVASKLQAALNGETVRFIIGLPRGDNVRTLDVTYVPRFREGSVDGYFVLAVDVTEAQREVGAPSDEDALAEPSARELLEQTHLVDRLFEATQGIVLILDAKGRIVRFNDFMENLSGRRLNDVLYQSWFDVFLPERDRARIKSLFSATLSGPPVVSNVNPIVTADGREIPIEWSGITLRGSANQVIGVLGIGVDITDRLSAQKAAQQSERRLSTLVKNLPGMAYRCKNDTDWTLVYVSTGSQKLTGYSAADLLAPGAPVYGDLIHPDDRQRVWQEVQAALDEREPFQLEYRIRSRTGEEKIVWEQGVAVVLEDGELVLEGFVMDVTTQRRADEKLRLSDARLNELIKTTQDGVIFADRHSRIVRVNPAAQCMFGYAEPELLGQHLEVLVPEPHSGEHENHVARYERTGQARAMGRSRMLTAKRKGGEEFPVELSMTELKVDDEVRYAAFIRDITEKVQLEEALLEKERLAAIGTTAAMFAHEVSNPLNSINLQIQLLDRRLQSLEGDPGLQRSLDTVAAEIQRLRRLLDEFRSFYRREQLQVAPTDIGSLLEETLRLHTANKQVHVKRTIAGDLPIVQANADKLKQVFVNLCKNALEAMPDGGVLEITASTMEDGVRVEIRDTGLGISGAVDVFEPFHTTKATGSGLGLPIVRQIIAAHGGRIFYVSEPSQGTTFTVELPCQPPRPPSLAPPT